MILNTTERPWDGWLLVVVCALLGLGVVMIYSASGITASWNFHDSMFFLKRQLIYVVIGFGLLITGLKLDYHWYQRLVYPILLVTVLFLLLVLVAGTDVNGARRWIRLGPINIQPAEIAKITISFVLAYSMAKKQDQIKTFSIGVLPHLMIIAVIVGLLMMQPDFGSSVLITTLMGAMLFFAGTRLIYIVGGLVLCVSFAAGRYLRGRACSGLCVHAGPPGQHRLPRARCHGRHDLRRFRIHLHHHDCCGKDARSGFQLQGRQGLRFLGRC